MRHYTKQIVLGLTAAVMATVAGCGAGDPSAGVAKQMNSQNIQRLSNLYVLYHQKNGFKGPTSVEEFKAFLKSNKVTKNLDFMKISPSEIDDCFVSERDGEAFKIRMGVPGNPRGCQEPLVFEATGQDGVRLVGFAAGRIEEVDDDKLYDDMFEGRWKPTDDRTEENLPKFDKDGNEI